MDLSSFSAKVSKALERSTFGDWDVFIQSFGFEILSEEEGEETTGGCFPTRMQIVTFLKDGKTAVYEYDSNGCSQCDYLRCWKTLEEVLAFRQSQIDELVWKDVK